MATPLAGLEKKVRFILTKYDKSVRWCKEGARVSLTMMMMVMMTHERAAQRGAAFNRQEFNKT